MWKKVKKEGINYWLTGRAEILKKHNNDLDLLQQSDPERFSTSGHDDYYWWEEEGIIGLLPSGIYKNTILHNDYALAEYEIQKKDAFIDLSVGDLVIKDFNNFLNSKNVYKELKMPFRRGVMIYGPPGTGKTFSVHNIIDSIKREDIIVIFTSNSLRMSYLKEFQKDDRLKLVVFEEFTNCLKSGLNDWYAPEEVLSFLDGEDSMDNMFVIATTNYPEKLPQNITKRPGRFDKFYKVGYLSKEDIIKYLRHFEIEPEDCIINQKSLTIAQLKELLLIVKREKCTFKEALKVLEGHSKLVDNDFKEFKQSMGFTFDTD